MADRTPLDIAIRARLDAIVHHPMCAREIDGEDEECDCQPAANAVREILRYNAIYLRAHGDARAVRIAGMYESAIAAALGLPWYSESARCGHRVPVCDRCGERSESGMLGGSGADGLDYCGGYEGACIRVADTLGVRDA